MKTRLVLPFLPLLVIAAAVSPAAALTADELIAKNIEAKGGMGKLKAIGSMKLTGKLVFAGDSGFELSFLQIVTRSGKVRQEAALQGLTNVQAWDGREGWQISPFNGRKDPEKLSADDAKGLMEDADIDGPIVDYQAKGNTVEFLGTEDVDGTEAYKLKVTLKNGDLKYYYLDPDYFLEIRITTRRVVRGTEQDFETDLGNYEQVAGVYVPFSAESGAKGAPKNQKLTFEKVEVNPPVDDAIFVFPAAQAR